MIATSMEKGKTMREKIDAIIKISMLISSMTTGFWLWFSFIWCAIGLPLENWSLWLLAGLAGLAEYGYVMWLKE